MEYSNSFFSVYALFIWKTDFYPFLRPSYLLPHTRVLPYLQLHSRHPAWSHLQPAYQACAWLPTSRLLKDIWLPFRHTAGSLIFPFCQSTPLKYNYEIRLIFKGNSHLLLAHTPGTVPPLRSTLQYCSEQQLARKSTTLPRVGPQLSTFYEICINSSLPPLLSKPLCMEKAT